MKERFLGGLIFWVYKLLMLTWRLEVHDDPKVKLLRKNNKAFIIAHWHGDELGILNQIGNYNGTSLVSSSKDGQLMAHALQKFGGQVVRGSSSKNSVQGLKGLLRMAKKGFCPVIAVDGPKGPLHQVKPGVFQVSRLCQIPIVPTSFWCSHSKTFVKSWNKAQLPKPFSRVSILFGEPIEPIEKGNSPHSQELARKLTDALQVTKSKAQLLGLPQ